MVGVLRNTTNKFIREGWCVVVLFAHHDPERQDGAFDDINTHLSCRDVDSEAVVTLAVQPPQGRQDPRLWVQREKALNWFCVWGHNSLIIGKLNAGNLICELSIWTNVGISRDHPGYNRPWRVVLTDYSLITGGEDRALVVDVSDHDLYDDLGRLRRGASVY